MAYKGNFTIDDWIVTAEPDSKITLSLSSNAIDPSKAIKAKDSVSYINKIDFEVELRPC